MALTVTSFVYDWANDVLSESYSGGPLNGLIVSNQYDACLRRTNLTLLNGASTLCKAIYGYDNASRLASVSDGVNSATYSHLANSPLVGQIMFASNATTRMTTVKQYDYLNRLSSISSTPSNAFSYLYNGANQRTMNRLWDGSYWRYGYDALGQVISGTKFWVDQTPVAGQQFEYAFDTIGNRIQTEAGGDQNGQNLRVANYTNNALNQMISRSVPGYVDVLGDGLATNGVTVNGLAAYRKGEYFREQLSVTNTSAAVWDNVTVAAPGQGSVTGHIYVPKTPENYTYDVDGNLLSDGRWTYAWDGENRLIGMTSLTNAPSGSQMQLAFAYDFQGRRIQKIVSTNNGSGYVGEYTNYYAYDAWNCLAILNSTGLLNSFLWGSDLSGSLQGAGGVGGLIKVTYYGASTTNCFVAFDGNGNVSALVNAADGTMVANYEYGPFGEVIRATGPMAKLNPFRFSTKYNDDETDFLYYGHRYYNPSTGRWLSRDPMTEDGGLNLYGFIQNSPLSTFDVLGMAPARLVVWVQIGSGMGFDQGKFNNYMTSLGKLFPGGTADYLNVNVVYGAPPAGSTAGWQPGTNCIKTYFVMVDVTTMSIYGKPGGGTVDSFNAPDLPPVGWWDKPKGNAVVYNDSIILGFSTPASSVPIESAITAAHEVGHALNAVHVTQQTSVMYRHIREQWVQTPPQWDIQSLFTIWSTLELNF